MDENENEEEHQHEEEQHEEQTDLDNELVAIFDEIESRFAAIDSLLAELAGRIDTHERAGHVESPRPEPIVEPEPEPDSSHFWFRKIQH